MPIDISKLSRDELESLLGQTTDRLKAFEEETVVALVEDVKKRAQEAGVSLNELIGRLKGSGGKKRGKVAAKYKNPKTGETWAGRGRKPAWLEKELAVGKKVEDFAIG